MRFFIDLFRKGKGKKQSGTEFTYPIIDCPKCHKRFTFEAILGTKNHIVYCPQCACGFKVELSLDKISKIQVYENIVEALSDAADEFRKKQKKGK